MAPDNEFEEAKQKNMRVHIFEVNVGDCEIKGFSKVRKPAKIRKHLQLNDPTIQEKLLIYTLRPHRCKLSAFITERQI